MNKIPARIASGGITVIEAVVLWAWWGWFAEPHGAPHLGALQWMLLLLARDWLRARQCVDLEAATIELLSARAGRATGMFILGFIFQMVMT